MNRQGGKTLISWRQACADDWGIGAAGSGASLEAVGHPHISPICAAGTGRPLPRALRHRRAALAPCRGAEDRPPRRPPNPRRQVDLRTRTTFQRPIHRLNPEPARRPHLAGLEPKKGRPDRARPRGLTGRVVGTLKLKARPNFPGCLNRRVVAARRHADRPDRPLTATAPRALRPGTIIPRPTG